jgi:AraC-like DNA-binding protein
VERPHRRHGGGLTYLLGGRRWRLEPGRWHIFWGAVPHQLIAVDPGTRCSWITVPLTWILRWQLPEAVLSSLLAGSLLSDAAPGDIAEHRRWQVDLHRPDARWHALVALEVEARLRRLALGRDLRTDPPVAPPAPGVAAHVERMAACIAEHHAETLRVDDIAAAAGLNPSYAMTLFRRHCGMSMIDYLTRYRVAHAQRLLATTDDEVTAIGFAAGFGSQSRFFEAFTAICGLPPRAYRRSLRR